MRFSKFLSVTLLSAATAIRQLGIEDGDFYVSDTSCVLQVVLPEAYAHALTPEMELNPKKELKLKDIQTCPDPCITGRTCQFDISASERAFLTNPIEQGEEYGWMRFDCHTNSAIFEKVFDDTLFAVVRTRPDTESPNIQNLCLEAWQKSKKIWSVLLEKDQAKALMTEGPKSYLSRIWSHVKPH